MIKDIEKRAQLVPNEWHNWLYPTSARSAVVSILATVVTVALLNGLWRVRRFWLTRLGKEGTRLISQGRMQDANLETPPVAAPSPVTRAQLTVSLQVAWTDHLPNSSDPALTCHRIHVQTLHYQFTFNTLSL